MLLSLMNQSRKEKKFVMLLHRSEEKKTTQMSNIFDRILSNHEKKLLNKNHSCNEIYRQNESVLIVARRKQQ